MIFDTLAHAGDIAEQRAWVLSRLVGLTGSALWLGWDREEGQPVVLETHDQGTTWEDPPRPVWSGIAKWVHWPDG